MLPSWRCSDLLTRLLAAAHRLVLFSAYYIPFYHTCQGLIQTYMQIIPEPNETAASANTGMAADDGVGPHANGDANAAGQPDTPVEVLTALLGKALQQQDPEAVKQLVQQAHAVVAGLDPYLDQISTPPSQASSRSAHL